MSQVESNSNNNAFKLCHLIKRPDFDGYGFNLHSEKSKPGQFIGKVDAKSPAEASNLKEGDRIVEVNGVTIGSATHKQVVQRIKALENEVRLLLIDVDGKGDGKSEPTATVAINGNGSAAVDNTNQAELKTPPPPSATKATVSKETVFTMQQSNVKETNGNKISGDGLQLNMTAAEMRASLLSKKKRDPKNESIDLKQKYEIIQQL